MTSRRRRFGAILALAHVCAVVFVLLTPDVSRAGTSENTNACKSNATGTFSDIDISLAGTAIPNPVAVGENTTLGSSSFQALVPADLLVAGYNLGFLSVGVNTIPVKWWTARQATNTVEGTNVQNGSTSVQTTITDPNGTPGTGDESATDLSVNVSLTDTVWTPTGGTIEFTQGGNIPTIAAGVVGPAAITPAGSVFFSAQVGPGGFIKANFDCRPGISSGDGLTFSPAAAVPFETVAITGGGSTTTGGATTTTAAPATTTTTAAPATTTTAPAATTTTVAVAATTTLPPPEQKKIHGSATNTNACKTNVSPAYSDLAVTVSSDAFPQPHLGDPIELTNTKLKLSFPADLFLAGYRLGFLSAGDNSIPATVEFTINATNTTPKSDAQSVSTSVTVTINDPTPGDPQSGDESAKPVVVSLSADDTEWTPADATKPVFFTMGALKITATVPGLPLAVVFTCEPGATDADGPDNIANNDDDGTTFTENQNPKPFVALAAEGTEIPTQGPTTTIASAGTTSAGAGSTSTTVPGATSLPVTGGASWWLVFVGLALVDIGYACWSATRPPRSRAATGAQP